VRDDHLARINSRWGACVLRVKAQPTTPRRQVFVPIHWNDQTASGARVGALVNPVVDPISGEPEFKHTPVRVEPFDVDWLGFVLARRPLPRTALDGATWWTGITGARFMRYELAGRGLPSSASVGGAVASWHDWARSLLDVPDPQADWLEASDVAEGMFRAAHVVDDRIDACVFASPRAEDLPARAWLSSLFAQNQLAEQDRVSLLAGAPANPQADTGPTVCSCFGVGRNVIVKAIREGQNTVEALGQSLKCGTNCGSCVPELKALLATARAAAA
jgi:assimilatory nitrate reductase catalytic subunit